MITRLIILILVTVLSGNSQNLTLSNMNHANLKLGNRAINFGTAANLSIVSSTITTEGTIIFTNAGISFENCTIRAEKVIFQTGVNTIDILGKVKIECIDIEFQNTPTPSQKQIDLTVQKDCELTIQYSNSIINTRQITCTSTDDYHFYILKK